MDRPPFWSYARRAISTNQLKPRNQMNNRTLKIAVIALLPLGFAAFSACSSGPQLKEQVVKTADGEAIIDTYSINATVTNIDAAKRLVTISDASGKRTTF